VASEFVKIWKPQSTQEVTFFLFFFFVNLYTTRNSLGDEIANVNFLCNDIVHTVQNTIDSCINSATDRRGYVLERRFTKFSEITQCNGSFKVTDITADDKAIWTKVFNCITSLTNSIPVIYYYTFL